VDKVKPACRIRFDKALCTGCLRDVKACPTRAVRMVDGRHAYVAELCIGCGECIRVCPVGAVKAVSSEFSPPENEVPVAIVSPVLYTQFPGETPENILRGLRYMGFHETMDISYFIEMFQCAAEEYIVRNRETRNPLWPLISPVCPVAVRLIESRFPSLLPHVLPIISPVGLGSEEATRRIFHEHGKKGSTVLYYINPCPNRMVPEQPHFHQERPYPERVIGINEIYGDLSRYLDRIRKEPHIQSCSNPFKYCAIETRLMWGMSGGEIAGINSERTLAISGLEATVAYLEKIESGMFQDVEYIEFRTCPEGCLGGTLTAVDRYLTKSVVQKMLLKSGFKRHLSRSNILHLYEEEWFSAKSDSLRGPRRFARYKPPLSIEALQEMDRLVELIQGMDCAACGAPSCREFAEDVVRGEASLSDCIVLRARGLVGERNVGKGKNEVDVKELTEKFGLEVAAGASGLNRKVRGGYCGDLLSDVMGKAAEGCVWLTIQGHQNILAVAVLREMAAVILVGGYQPEAETREKADKEGIPILLWHSAAFELAGRLYEAGVGK
jgi:Na+-translocating ferredoxin:NAD+ oxidoreductase RNF subunit RnfB